MDISNLKDLFSENEIQILDPTIIEDPTRSMMSQIKELIQDADLIIGILSDIIYPNVILELGISVGLSKPTLVLNLSSQKNNYLGLPQINISDLTNKDVLEFNLLPFLENFNDIRSIYSHKLGYLGNTYDTGIDFSKELEAGYKLEKTVKLLFEKAKYEIYDNQEEGDFGVDLLIWMNNIGEDLDNPIVVQIKGNVDLNRTDGLSNIKKYISSIGNKFLIIITNEIKPQTEFKIFSGDPNLVIITLKKLVDLLDKGNFERFLLQCRNYIIHGG